MVLDFKGRAHTLKKTKPMNKIRAKALMDTQFNKIGLNTKARYHFIDKFAHAGRLDAKKYNAIVNEAKKKGYIKAVEAERMKDTAHIHDKWNKHWD